MQTHNDHFKRAASLRMAGDMDGAVGQYRQAIAQEADNPVTWNALGTVLRSLGQMDEANDCFRQAIGLQPDFAEGYQNLAQGGQLTADSPEMHRLATIANDNRRPVSDRDAAAFALGKALDDAGHYDEAFAAYRQANALHKEWREALGDWFDPLVIRRAIDVLIATFTPAFFAEAAAWGNRSEAPVFIVGMPRSGTSLVEQIAASHSRIFGAGELLDIPRLNSQLRPEQAQTGQGWTASTIGRLAGIHLERLRTLAGDADRIIDKLPDNVLLLGFIATLFPAARVIICRRDPRDIALSCFFQKFTVGSLTFTYDLADCGRRHRETERLIAHWRQALPLRMLEINYETLVADLPGQSRRLIDFLGLEWEPACLDFHRTIRKVETASVWQVRQPLYDRSAGRWRNYEKHLEPLNRALAGDEPEDPVAPETRQLRNAVATALAEADACYTEKDLDRAEARYRDVLRLVLRHHEAQHWLGVIAGIRGNHAEAARLLSASVAAMPMNAGAQANLANAYHRSGQLKEAEAAYRTALSFDPDFPRALDGLGQVLIAGKQDAEAREIYRHLVIRHPNDANGVFRLAGCLRRTGDMAGSLEHLQRVVVLAPALVSGWMDLGLTHANLRQWAEAERCLMRVLALDPASGKASQALAQVRRERVIFAPPLARSTRP